MEHGLFITFEGIEGCGKSTQLKLVADDLKAKGCDVVTTREPGGTVIGDQIRRILLAPEHKNLEPLAELFLYAAARAQHVHELIRPELARGKVVLCDRYVDATRAYQGAARQIDPQILERLIDVPTGGLMPTLTLILDCPVEVGLRRAVTRNAQHPTTKEDRFEREARDFHERVRLGYLAIAKQEPKRVKIIDATGSVESIHQTILQEVDRVVHNSRA
ncbi:MAG: dTMP kinase [Deltaproteobacteria bacterium]|nr:dTMP kinase [Deltaproteobacteria bacterium]